MYTPYINPASAGYVGDLGANSFSDVGGGTLNQKVISQWDFYKPNEWIDYIARHSGYVGFHAMLRTMGFSNGTAKPTVGHYEKPWSESLVPIGTIITPSGGAGNNMVVALDASGMYTPGVAVNGTAAYASYPVANDILMLKDGNKAFVVSKNTTTNPHRLTLRPVDSAVDLDNSITAGDALFVSGNAFGEGTGLPAGRTPRMIKYTNTFQIVKEMFSATGSEMSNQMYFNPMPGVAGSYVLMVRDDTYKRMERSLDYTLLFGEQHNNLTQFNANLGFDVPIAGTEGFDTFVLTNGNQQPYTPGTLTVQDFDDIGRIFTLTQIGTRDILSLQGYDLRNEWENVLASYFTYDNADFLADKFFAISAIAPVATSLDNVQTATPRAGDFAVNIGFKGIVKGGYNYGFASMEMFNDAVGAGADGYNYIKSGYFMPVGFTKERSSDKGKPTIGYEYKQLGGFSREMVVASYNGVGTQGAPIGDGTLGMMAQGATGPNDIANTGFLSEIAGHWTCGNHTVAIYPQ